MNPDRPQHSTDSSCLGQTTTAKKPLRIRLIHGTWGRAFFLKKPRWFEEHSLFRTRFELALSKAGIEADIKASPWSGAQAVTARHLAAKALADELLQEQKDEPPVTQIIIGHSHGGTVGMLAAHQMGEGGRELLLATLATPFMQIHPGRLGSAFTRHLEIWIANVFPFIILVAGLYATNRSPQDLGWRDAPLIIGLLFVATIISAVLFRAVLGSWIDPNRVSTKITRLHFMTLGGAEWGGRRAPLIIRAVDDEASLTLAAGAIANRLTSLMFVSGAGLAFWIGTLLAPVILVQYWNDDLQNTLQNHSAVAFYVVVAFPAISFLLLAACGIFKAVYGRELLFGALRVEINSQSVPDIAGQIAAFTLPPVRSRNARLRHSIYDEEMVVPALVAWIRASIGPTP
jgi:hypothetical protein